MVTTPALTRFAQAMAVLAGLGASIGIGIGVVILGDKATQFAATNAMSMPKRQVLLKCLFGCMLALPALFGTIVVLRVNDPNRLRSLERVARGLAPLTGFGLLPLLFQSEMWKGKTELFLGATLICTLVVYGSLRAFVLPTASESVRRLSDVTRASTPAFIVRYLPWVVLVLVCSFAVSHTMRVELPKHVPQVLPVAPTTMLGAIRQLASASVLAVPFVTQGFLRSHAEFSRFVTLTLVVFGSLPLFAWARIHLGTVASLVVAGCYLTFPHLLAPGQHAVLPMGAAALFFFTAAYAFEKRRTTFAILASILALLVHEQVAFWLVCFGVYLSYRRPSFLSARLLVVVPLAYFSWVAFSLLPGLRIETYGAALHSLWSGREPGLSTLLVTLVTNPAHALRRLSGEREAIFWLQMLVPFALLPLRSKTWLLWLSPFVLFGVVAQGHFPRDNLTHPTVAHFIVMGFAAAITTLSEIRRGKEGRSRFAAALIAWCFALAPTVYQLGCIWLPAL